MQIIEITILNTPSLRHKFIQNFLISWDEFQISHKDFIENIAKNGNIIFDEKMYNESLMWDKMPTTYPKVSFNKALNFLKSKNHEIIFISETDNYPFAFPLTYKGENIPSFIAKADAKALASLIEYEWFESYRLAEQGMYNPDFMLPEDLYVFDDSFEWVIVFTHETLDYETESLMVEAESRLCIMYTK